MNADAQGQAPGNAGAATARGGAAGAGTTHAGGEAGGAVVFDFRAYHQEQWRRGKRGWDYVTSTGDASGTPSFAGAEPTFLNHHAWVIRWQDRARSSAMAQAVLDFSRAVGKARAVGSRRRNGLAMRTLAWQARWRGDFDQAESLAHRAIARLKGEGAESAIADALATLAVIHVSRGRRDLARESIEDGFEILVRQPDIGSRIDLLTTLAMIERYGRRFRLAQDAMLEAISISTGAERARTEHSVARTLLHDDRPGEALEHANRSIALAREHHNRLIMPYAMECAAAALIDLDRPNRCCQLLDDGEAIARQDADRRAECHLLYQRVRLNQHVGEAEGALRLASQGQDMAGAMGYPLWQARFMDRAAELQEALGQTRAALGTLKELIALRAAERE